MNEKKSLENTINQFLSDTGEFEPLVQKGIVEKIDADLRKVYFKEVLKARKDTKIKNKLVDIIFDEYKSELSHEKALRKKQAKWVVEELVGTGIIGMIIEANADITDIGWNGTHLALETNDEKIIVKGEKLGIDHTYVERVIQKYARANDKEFNESLPRLDGMIGNVRLNAIHRVLSPDGATLSLRVTRPLLALSGENFEAFAPIEILELLELIVKTNANIFISGETGSGKTELQKLLLSFVNEREKIVMIEDVRETHAKTLFEDKDIYSWITGKNTSITDLTSASLRNNPKWIIISETRGKEAYEMMQAILSGHHVVTTLHATDALAIPRRFVNMCASGYDVNEQMLLSDFLRYVDFGIHIERQEINGKVVRYLSELVEFSNDETQYIFRQTYNGITKKFEYEYGKISVAFLKRMQRKGLTFEFKEGVNDGESKVKA